ncbi:hypothetical protein PJP13_24290 [Mycobacterium kansasii]
MTAVVAAADIRLVVLGSVAAEFLPARVWNKRMLADCAVAAFGE